MSITKAISTIPRAALIYVTVGALTVVWSSVWYVYVLNDAGRAATTLYWCVGFLLTGVTLMLIGLVIGWVGRTRRPVDTGPRVNEAAAQPGAEPEALAAAAPVSSAAKPAYQPERSAHANNPPQQPVFPRRGS